MTDTQLLEEATEGLLMCDCMFDMCPGFQEKPVHMATCKRCWTLHEIFLERPGLFKKLEAHKHE